MVFQQNCPRNRVNRLTIWIGILVLNVKSSTLFKRSTSYIRNAFSLTSCYRKPNPFCNIISNISDSIEQSFYRGQVNVTFKENVFQLGRSFGSVLEIQKALIYNGFSSQNTTHLYMMTSGGPKHRVNFESVKISLILMFKQLKLDSLIAIRTAPGQSYVNIVERIMSIFNIGFQNVALEREELGSDEEIRKCKDLFELRQKPTIKDDWQKSVQPLVVVLIERAKGLALKDVPFKVSFISVSLS